MHERLYHDIIEAIEHSSDLSHRIAEKLQQRPPYPGYRRREFYRFTPLG
jgi:hypothetical protein